MSLRDGDQPLKLGLFGTNASGGILMTGAPSGYELSWEHTSAIARTADRLGFDLLLPIARWRGYGGRLDPNGQSFETFSWAAGLAAQTERIAIVSTCHAPAIHPVVAAKSAATIDHISAGRLGLNLVMGWFTPELAMFGAEPLAHEARYAYGAEWLEIVDRLWAEREPFDYAGEHFRLAGAQGWPKPRQSRPVVINAGNSPAGIAFSARHADINFATIFTLDSARQHVEQIKQAAREQDRELSVMTYGTVVCAATRSEAEARYETILAHGDWEAAENFMHFLGLNSESFGDQIQHVRERFVSSGGGYPIVGTPDEVAAELVALSRAGIDGMVLGFLDYLPELEAFGEQVLPLLVDAGVRRR